MSNKNRFKPSDLVCLDCGNVASIMRGSGRYRPKGHIKDLWCYKCQKVTKHYEVHDISKFMYEYNSDVLDEKKVYDLVLSRRKVYARKR